MQPLSTRYILFEFDLWHAHIRHSTDMSPFFCN